MEVNKKHLSRELHRATRRRHSQEPPQAQLEEGAQQRWEKPSLHHETGLARAGRGAEAEVELYEASHSEPRLSAGEREPCLGGWERRKSNYFTAPKAQ